MRPHPRAAVDGSDVDVRIKCIKINAFPKISGNGRQPPLSRWLKHGVQEPESRWRLDMAGVEENEPFSEEQQEPRAGGEKRPAAFPARASSAPEAPAYLCLLVL